MIKNINKEQKELINKKSLIENHNINTQIIFK